MVVTCILSHFTLSVTLQLQLKEVKYSPDLSFLTLLDIEDVDYIYESSGDWWRELARYITFRSNSMGTTVAYRFMSKFVKKLPKNRKRKIQDAIDNMKKTLQDAMGDDGVLLFPSFPDTAHHHHDIYRWIFDTGYLALFNALGFPVTNCPLGLDSNGMPLGIQVLPDFDIK